MSKIKLIGAGAKYAGKTMSSILKAIKHKQSGKKSVKAIQDLGLGTKSIKPFNIRAKSRRPGDQVVPVKKQSQKGSSFQEHKVRGTMATSRVGYESPASWRDEMESMYGDIKISKFFKKSTGGDISTGMKKLSKKQKAIAAKAPPPNKIDAKDFAVLKAEKAKGRGMGLQDESIKPGKVQKAVFGKMIKSAGKSIGRLFGGKQSATVTPGAVAMSGSGQGIGGMLPKLLQKAIDDGIIKPASKGRMMKAKRGKFLRSDPTKPISSVKPLGTLGKGMKVSKAHSIVLGKMSNEKLKEMVKTGINPDAKGDSNIKRGSQKTSMEAKSFLDRRKELASPKNILNAAKATRYGKIALGIAGAALGAKELLKSKMKKEDKKMGGGMAKKYSVGGVSSKEVYTNARANVDAEGRKNMTMKDLKEARRETYSTKKMVGGMAKKYSTGMTLADMKPYGGSYVKKKAEMKASQTENVKKLTTSDDAYSPERMFVVTQGTRKGNSSTPSRIRVTDDLNAKRIADTQNELNKGKNIRSFATYKLPPALGRDYERRQQVLQNMANKPRSYSGPTKKMPSRRTDLKPRPMMPKYKSGVMVKVKLGRNKPTKIC